MPNHIHRMGRELASQVVLLSRHEKKTTLQRERWRGGVVMFARAPPLIQTDSSLRRL